MSQSFINSGSSFKHKHKGEERLFVEGRGGEVAQREVM